MDDTVEIPVALLESFSEAAAAFARFEDEFEEFLIGQNAPLIERLERAAQEHQAGDTRPFSEIRRS
jgi:hypothetical protein